MLAVPVLARADANPDFNEDAKPILRAQPGLVSFVRSHFEVKETGKAKYPGDDDHRPAPPFIFRARPVGSSGPFNIRLLIEPGPPGHILCVVPPNNGAPAQPSPPQEQPPQVAQGPQPAYQSPSLSEGEVKPLPPENATPPAPNPVPPPPAPASPSEPTADTPSGPIIPNNSSSGTANPQQNLAPPPDPAPSNQ